MPTTDALTDEDRLAIGRRLLSMREMFEYTQAVVAERCYVSQPAVSAWERGVKIPARSTQHRLAELYRTQRSMLFVEIVRAEERAAAA